MAVSEKILRIVHLEDNPSDAELVGSLLESAGIASQRTVVHSHASFQQALRDKPVDLILSDFSMPSYDGLSALKFARESYPDIPFIFVSGKIGEDAAIESLKSGATDYVIKDRLARLPAAVGRAIKELEDRRKRKQTEAALKEREERVLRTQRLESLGSLAGGIAHDLNNVLLPVVLGLEVLREKLPEKADQEIIAVLENSVSRGTALVKQVLNFARGAEGEKVQTNPARLVREVVDMARRTFPAEIAVRSDVSSELHPVVADPTQIHQVLLNLAVNARDAMEGGGTLKITVRNAGAVEISPWFLLEEVAKDYVLFEVSDTGHGIPPDIRHRIFDPFFTTKTISKGTGLGLANCIGIIKGHRGLIDFSSEVGKGTTFRVFLPASGAVNSESAATQRPPEKFAVGGEVILIVDDEPAVREVAKALLSAHGYHVLTSDNGGDAVQVFERFLSEIDAVLIDRRMPILNGPEAAIAMRQMKHGVKIVGMSGDGASAVETGFTSAAADGFLAKPFTADQLLALFDRLFHERV